VWGSAGNPNEAIRRARNEQGFFSRIIGGEDEREVWGRPTEDQEGPGFAKVSGGHEWQDPNPAEVTLEGHRFYRPGLTPDDLKGWQGADQLGDMMFYHPEHGWVLPADVWEALMQINAAPDRRSRIPGMSTKGNFRADPVATALGYEGRGNPVLANAGDVPRLAATYMFTMGAGAAAEAAQAAAAAEAAQAASETGMLGRIGQSAARGALGGGIGAATSGGNLGAGMLGGAVQGGVTGGINEAGTALRSSPAPVTPEVELFGPSSYMMQPGFMNAGSVEEALANSVSPVTTDMLEGVLYTPGMLQSAPPQPVLEAPKPAQAAPKPAEKPVDYGGIAKKVYDLYKSVTGDVPGFEAPAREEGQTDEQYFTEVGEAAIEYLSLDAAAMRAEGLVPGTPQYIEYILSQADAIIEQVFDDPAAMESPEELKAALRDLNSRDAAQLVRALHVRGALGSMTSASSVVDPFSGISEEIGMLPGEQVKGAEAARQRGLARSVEGLATGPRDQAKEKLSGMLGRNVDLFGMQEKADARRTEAEQAEDEERRKRRQRK